MSLILRDLILKNLDSAPYSTDSNNTNQEIGINAIASALNEYIRDNYNMISTTVGTYFIPPVTFLPLVELLSSDLFTTTHTPENLVTNFNNILNTGISSNGTQRLFQALDLWLNSPPYQVIYSAFGTILQSTIPSDIPTIPISFPTVITQGIICENEINITSFPTDVTEAKKKAWEIVAKHIQICLNANIVSPSPIFGLATVSNYTYVGVATTILSFP